MFDLFPFSDSFPNFWPVTCFHNFFTFDSYLPFLKLKIFKLSFSSYIYTIPVNGFRNCRMEKDIFEQLQLKDEEHKKLSELLHLCYMSSKESEGENTLRIKPLPWLTSFASQFKKIGWGKGKEHDSLIEEPA